MLWRGRYLDGRTAASRTAEIRLVTGGLKVVLEDGTALTWPYGEIRQSQGHYAGDPVRLERGGEPAEVLIVDDADFLSSLRAKAPRQAGRFHNPAFRRLRVWLVFYAALVTLAVSFGFYHWGIPSLARLIAQRVPVSWEKGLGESGLGVLAPPEKRLHDPRLDRAIAAITARLARTVPHCPYRFQVAVCDLPIVNALALPGGYIVVYRGLLDETRRPEELAGVLAHEMQHVLKRHTTQRIIQDSSTGLLLSALSGDATGSMAFGLQSVRALALLEYSRTEEEEADREGMKAVLAAGIDPEGMIRFFQTLQKHGKEPEFLRYVSTHPATLDRIKDLQGIVALYRTPAGKDLLQGLRVSRRAPLLPGTNWPELVKHLGRLK